MYKVESYTWTLRYTIYDCAVIRTNIVRLTVVADIHIVSLSAYISSQNLQITTIQMYILNSWVSPCWQRRIIYYDNFNSILDNSTCLSLPASYSRQKLLRWYLDWWGTWSYLLRLFRKITWTGHLGQLWGYALVIQPVSPSCFWPIRNTFQMMTAVCCSMVLYGLY